MSARGGGRAPWAIEKCINEYGVDEVAPGHEHLDAIGAASHFAGHRTFGSVVRTWPPSRMRRRTMWIAIRRSFALLSDTAQLCDALDARADFEPMRDLNKFDDR